MRRDSLLRRRGLLAFGVITACVTVTATAAAAAVPAYAGPTGPAHSSAVPYASAPVSGHMVSGAIYGTAARTGAGVAATDFLKAHKQMVSELHASAGIKPNSQQLHYWWGSFPDTNSGNGAIATQSVSLNLRLSHSGDILYAPTMTPADNPCIEVVTVHSTWKPEVWAWDWCNTIAPAARVIVNGAFKRTYTKMVNGRTAYTTQIVQTDASTNTWTSYLYNYTTGAWDTLFTSAGADQTGLSFGWDMYEFYSRTDPSTGNTYVCGDLAKAGTSLQSSSLQIRANGSWGPANATNSSWSPKVHPNPAAYLCPGVKFHILHNNDNWLVHVTR